MELVVICFMVDESYRLKSIEAIMGIIHIDNYRDNINTLEKTEIIEHINSTNLFNVTMNNRNNLLYEIFKNKAQEKNLNGS